MTELRKPQIKEYLEVLQHPRTYAQLAKEMDLSYSTVRRAVSYLLQHGKIVELPRRDRSGALRFVVAGNEATESFTVINSGELEPLSTSVYKYAVGFGGQNPVEKALEYLAYIYARSFHKNQNKGLGEMAMERRLEGDIDPRVLRDNLKTFVKTVGALVDVVDQALDEGDLFLDTPDIWRRMGNENGTVHATLIAISEQFLIKRLTQPKQEIKVEEEFQVPEEWTDEYG